MALPHGAVGLSALCDCGSSDYHHLFFSVQYIEDLQSNMSVHALSHLINSIIQEHESEAL